jgi:hypothetical protein
VIEQDPTSRYRPRYCVRYEDYLRQQMAFVPPPLPTPLVVLNARAEEARITAYDAQWEAA